MRPTVAAALSAALCAVLLPAAGLLQGCLFDASERCGKNQVFDATSESCVCPATAPPLGSGCVPCAAGDARPACQQGPSGFGTPCATDADCSGFDASHCEVLQAHVCVVSPCTKSPDSCTGGQSCCDLAKLGVPLSLCLPPGQCPAP
jgi:hypothetical protein